MKRNNWIQVLEVVFAEITFQESRSRLILIKN